jgi:Xaa-Pro aminopeptidase
MQVIDELGLDAVLITNGTNRRYLTGFSAEDHAPDELSGVVLLDRNSTTLFTSPTNLPWARSEVRSHVEVRPSPKRWVPAVVLQVQHAGVRRLGFEDATTTYADYAALRDALPGVELVPVGDRTDVARRVKRPEEVESVSRALRITDRAFEQVSTEIRAGMTEIAVAGAVRQALHDLGSEGEAFPTIVASGPNAAKPHHAPGHRTITDGEPVIIDMGARADGYCGDLTRTIWVGQPSQQLVTMYRLVLEAQRAAIESIREGVEARAIDSAARAVFSAAGMEHGVLHSVGHGVGLRIHEAPALGQASTDVLEAGDVITIEPGLYLPGWGGVRIEDVLLVEKNGSRNLTEACKLRP